MSCLSTSSPAAIRKNRSNFATLMTWLAGVVFDCTAAIMASESLARSCRARAGFQLTIIRFSRIFWVALKIDPRQGAVANSPPIIARRGECGRWQWPLFMLVQTTASTTGSCVAILGTSSATTLPEKPPSWLPKRSRESARPNSLFISLTEERAARVSERDGQPDCSADDGICRLLDFHAVDMFAGPRQQLRQGHEPRRARNLPAAVHKHQRRYALDGEAPQQFWHRVAVHLDQPHLRLELGCRPFENWRHCPAGTAPGRPEINEQRNVTVPCMLVEAHDAVQYNRPTFVKWQTAGPALPAIA